MAAVVRALAQAVHTGSKSSCVRSRGVSAGCKLQRISLLLLAHGRRRCRRCAVDSSCTALSTHRVPALRQARSSGVSAAGRAVHCPCFKMAGAAEPTAAQAAAYIQNHVPQAQALLPWISVAAGAVLGGAVAGCGHMQTAAPPCTLFTCGLHHFRKLSAWQILLADGASPPELAGNFEEAISKPLQTLVGRAYSSACRCPAAFLPPSQLPGCWVTSPAQQTVLLSTTALNCACPSGLWVSEELAPSARLAARLAVDGLAAGLPPPDALNPAMQDSLLTLCRMLHKKMHWDLLDTLAAGSCAAL